MWCRQVRNQLSAYTDGELPAAQMRAVEQHLACCSRCEAERARIQQVIRLSALVPCEEAPSGLHSRIMARVAYAGQLEETAPASAARAGVWMNFGFPAGIAAAALAVGLTHGPRESDLAPSTGSASSAAQPQPARKEVTSRPPAPESRGFEPRQEKAADTTAAAAPAGEVHLPAEPVQAVPPPQPAKVAALPERSIAPAVPPAPAAEPERPAGASGPVLAKPSGKSVAPAKPAGDGGHPEPNALPESAPVMAVMPAVPVMNSAGVAPMQPEPVQPAVDKDGGMTMMAGSPVETELPSMEDEGVKALRQFLEERIRTVPQPPTADPARARRKSL